MSRPLKSLFARMMVGQAAIIAAVAVGLPILLSVMLHETAETFIATRLNHDAVTFAASVARFPRRDDDNHGRFIALLDRHGKVVAAPPGQGPLPPEMLSAQLGAAPLLERRSHYDVLSRPAPLPDGATGWAVVAQDQTRPDEAIDGLVRLFIARFAWVIVAAMLASLALSMVVLRRITGAFRRAAAEANAIGLQRLDARIDAAKMPSEAVPLVAATNRAIERLETGYRAQGEFIGNVAHELRTPLALIALRVEQLPAEVERRQIELGVDQANHVVHQLMELAAIDRLHPELTTVDPARIARDVVEDMVPIVYRADHSIAFEASDCAARPIRAVEPLLRIALTNLIDNAVRHTPAGCSIIVTIDGDGGLSVADDGPGLAIEPGAATRRFRRGDTARSDSAGLGLSIVERIMTVCGGALETGRSEMGGAVLRLRFAPAGL